MMRLETLLKTFKKTLFTTKLHFAPLYQERFGMQVL
jgi:hypothetical protein